MSTSKLRWRISRHLRCIAAALIASLASAQAPGQSFFAAPENTLTVSELGAPFEMVWRDHRVGDRVVERAFLMIPAGIEGIDEVVFLQLDLGTPSTVLYRAALQSVVERGGKLPAPIADEATVSGVELHVGTSLVTARSLPVVDQGGPIDWGDRDSGRVLGTVGADWIDGRVLVLDYARNRLQLRPEVPDSFAEHELEPFSFPGRRIFLPAELEGQSVRLWFDTGSSAFELITDEENFHAMALEGAEEEVYPAQSWGQTVKVHNIAADAKVLFGSTEIRLRHVSHIEWPDPRRIETMTRALKGMGLGGMCGNLLFTDRTLLLDAKNKLFWIGEHG